MAGTFSEMLFKPAIKRDLDRGGARIENVTLDQGSDENSEGFIFSSGTFRYDPAGMALKSVQQLNIDFSKFENHTFFNSAAAKTQAAFEKIINQFPFDGSRKELTIFRDRINGFDAHVLKLFPKNVGFSHFERGTSGITDSSGFAQGNHLVVKDFTGANVTLFDPKDGVSILDPTGKDFCIEFQLYLPQEENDNEIIFQRLGEDTTASVGAQHFGVTLALSESNSSVVADTTLTGSLQAILSSGSFALSENMLLSKGNWNHVAMVFNSTTDQFSLYRNAQLIVTSAVGSFGDGATVAPVTIGSGSNHEAFGVLFEPKQTLSGALDELRFWHEPRKQSQINSFKNSNVFASEQLKLYLRFNEPSGSFGTLARGGNSSLVLDHSGNGLHTGMSNFDMTQRERRNLPLPLTEEITEDSPILFPSFSTVVDLNENLMTTASNYDLNNPNLITKLIPQHYLQEASADEGFNSDVGDINDGYGYTQDVPGGGRPGSPQILAALLYVMAANMDELKVFISEFGRLLKVDVKDDRIVSSQFLPFLAKYYGLNLPTAFKNASIQQMRDGKGANLDKVLSNLSLQEIQNTIWRRVLSDVPTLMRSRGTRHSIEALLRNIGIRPGSLFKIREYGGARRKTISDTFEKKTEVAAMLDFSGSFNAAGTIGGTGKDSQRPHLQSGFLSASRVEPGKPAIAGSFVNGISNSRNDGFLTSGSFSLEGRFKFEGNRQLRNQSLLRLQTTGSNASKGPLLMYNVVATPPITASNVTGSVFLYGQPQKGSSLDPALKMVLTGVNVFDGSKWHVSFGRTRNDFNNSVATSSYFLRAGKMNAGRLSSFSGLEQPYDDSKGLSLKQFAADASSNGPFVAIGSQSLEPNTSVGFLNANTDGVARTTFFGGKASNIRFYSKDLTEKETLNHIRNFKSVGTENPLINFGFNTADSGTFERLRLDLSVDQPVTMSDSSGKINIFDFSQSGFTGLTTGFEPNKGVIKPERFDFEILSSRFELATATNKVRVRSFKQINNIKQFGGALAPLYEIPQDEEPKDDRRLSVDISSVQALNEDIVNILATLDFFDDAIGAPELVFASEYRDLRNLRKQYFNRLDKKLNLEKFFKFYKWFDDTIGDIIEEFLPSSTNYLGTNFIIESHMLERNKFQYNYSDMYIGEIERLEQGTIFLQQFLANLRKF